METLFEEKIENTIKEKYPDINLSKSDIEECKESLTNLGKAIYLYLLEKGGSDV